MYLVGDFETTSYEGQVDTEVWASALVELYSEDVEIFHSIAETYDYLTSLRRNIRVYYHNLKFDGNFWLYYLLHDRKLKQATNGKTGDDLRFVPTQMKNNSVSYVISDMGQWYSITIRVNNKFIEIRDSLKLLPFSVKRLGESFGTKHRKLSMDYKGKRYAGCEISESDRKYIANDVLVVKEALEIMFEQGNKRLTIGSCCLGEYKYIVGKEQWEELFPNLYEEKLDKTIYGSDNVDEYIRRSYHGGWCYLVKGMEKKIVQNGSTYDVNSLYPSMMSSQSGNKYPIGYPVFWSGNYIPKEAMRSDSYFFVRLRTQFYLKDKHLPCIQIKNDLSYKATEWLETSDIFNPGDGCYYDTFIDDWGQEKPALVELTLTMTDYYLIKDHYNLKNTEILDGCYFNAQVGIFDEYIEKYKKIKQENKGAIRELAKLFLNNLYGKMASSVNSSFKYVVFQGDKMKFITIHAKDRLPVYIPCGSAITSYSRNFTIRHAQANYNPGGHGFVYADTDSIHGDFEDLHDIRIHDTDFCAWKRESNWTTGYFLRQKTYIEVISKDGEEECQIKCAGMPERSKELLIASLTGRELKESEEKKYTEQEKEWASKKRELADFDIGLEVPGKLLPKHMPGGIVLTDATFKILK